MERKPPAMEIPDSDTAKGPRVVAAYVVGCAVAIISVAMRLWARLSIHAVGLDDWCVLVALLLFLVQTIMCSLFILNGGFEYLFYPNSNTAALVHYTKVSWASTIVSGFAISMGKVSVALLIVRILKRTSRWRIWSLYTVSAITLLNCIGSLVVIYTQCSHIGGVKASTTAEEFRCWDPTSGTVKYGYTVYAATFNAALDFYLAILPIPIVWNSKLSRRDRIGLSLLLGCGIITGMVSAVRATFTGLAPHSHDFTYQMYVLNITTAVETSSVIVLGSLPPLRVLYNRYVGTSTSGTRTVYLSNFVSGDRTLNSATKPGYIPMDSLENQSSNQAHVPGPTRDAAHEVHVTWTFEARWESASMAANRSSRENMF